MSKGKQKVHLWLDPDVYDEIWNIVKKRYVSPTRKFGIVVNEALREYIEKHKNDQ